MQKTKIRMRRRVKVVYGIPYRSEGVSFSYYLRQTITEPLLSSNVLFLRREMSRMTIIDSHLKSVATCHLSSHVHPPIHFLSFETNDFVCKIECLSKRHASMIMKHWFLKSLIQDVPPSHLNQRNRQLGKCAILT